MIPLFRFYVTEQFIMSIRSAFIYEKLIYTSRIEIETNSNHRKIDTGSEIHSFSVHVMNEETCKFVQIERKSNFSHFM